MDGDRQLQPLASGGEKVRRTGSTSSQLGLLRAQTQTVDRSNDIVVGSSEQSYRDGRYSRDEPTPGAVPQPRAAAISISSLQRKRYLCPCNAHRPRRATATLSRADQELDARLHECAFVKTVETTSKRKSAAVCRATLSAPLCTAQRPRRTFWTGRDATACRAVPKRQQ